MTPKAADPQVIDQCAAAHWNVNATTKWEAIPEAWKPFYREAMKAALEKYTALELFTTAQKETP